MNQGHDRTDRNATEPRRWRFGECSTLERKELFVADDEGHGFANPENQLRLYRAIERHFAEHLRP